MRVARRVVAWSVVGLLVWFLWPTQFGGRFSEVVVSGRSMEPTYHDGEMVITEREHHYEAGDAIVYRVPNGHPGSGLLVVHRVVRVRPDGTMVVRGDNRATIDQWFPRRADVLGRAIVVVPFGGRMLLGLTSPLVLAAIAGLLVTWRMWPDRLSPEGLLT